MRMQVNSLILVNQMITTGFTKFYPGIRDRSLFSLPDICKPEQVDVSRRRPKTLGWVIIYLLTGWPCHGENHPKDESFPRGQLKGNVLPQGSPNLMTHSPRPFQFYNYYRNSLKATGGYLLSECNLD